MPRGRRAIPDEVKALKGNPGKRKLALQSAGADDARPASTPSPLTFPEFLTGPREREIYRRVVEEYLQRNVARSTDLNAYGRWAHYLDRWWLLKDTLKDQPDIYKVASNHGTYFRQNPLHKLKLDHEKVLQSLEDRLGLNPAARQNLMRGLAALPPPALSGFFGDDAPEKNPDDKSGPAAPIDAVSALGYLENAAAPPNRKPN